jgi:hypothetical protein
LVILALDCLRLHVIVTLFGYISYIGVSADNFVTVLLGRALFGCGGESVAVAQQTLVSGDNRLALSSSCACVDMAWM